MAGDRYFTGLGFPAKVTVDGKDSIRHLQRNDRIRGDGTVVQVRDGEETEAGKIDAATFDRLDRLGYISPDPWAFPPAEAETEAAEARLVLQRSDTGESSLAAMTDAQLADLWAEKPPTVSELTDAVADDPTLAQRVLDAETTASKGEPRVTLVEAMEKVKAAAE